MAQDVNSNPPSSPSHADGHSEITPAVDPDDIDYDHVVAGDDVDDYGSDSDDSSDSCMTEIGQEDIPSYFIEQDGRLFHSHGNSPYPLPVDTPEQQVCGFIYHLLTKLIPHL